MLKALELSGFKSFADKTRFEFPPGITVVVGPNGSGQSHIVDDIKELCTQMAIINKGEVVLQGNPLTLIEQLNGKVYQKTVKRAEVEIYKKTYQVVNDKLFLGKPLIQIVSEEDPGNGFAVAEATLEDVYFSQINLH